MNVKQLKKDRTTRYREAALKRWSDPKYRRLLSKVHKGNQHVRGKHWKLSERAIENIRRGHLGDKTNFWKGGISKVPGYYAHLQRIRKYRIRGNGGKHTYEEWLNLKNKYGNKCLSCGKSEPIVKLTEDHILPISKGGNSDIENIQPLCFSCNCKKRTREMNYLNQATL